MDHSPIKPRTVDRAVAMKSRVTTGLLGLAAALLWPLLLAARGSGRQKQP
jgi:hypothetical protein